MPSPAVAEIVVALFSVMAELTAYPGPRELPRIHVLSSAQMEADLCKGPCGIRAYYLDGDGIYLRADLDVANDLKSRSILLHELVHHLQHESGRFDKLSACARWLIREDEAYRVQNAYLSKMHSGIRFVFDFLPTRCRDPDAESG